MRTYKDRHLNRLYQQLLGKTPDWLREHKIWGAILHNFEKGYNGTKQPYYLSRGSEAYIAYMAGKDTRSRMHK